MGDAGSLFIGLILAWYVIHLSQGEGRAIAPAQGLWILMLPLFDTVRLLIWRPVLGRSPFGAGHDHLHHILRSYGLSHAHSTWLMLALSAITATTGLTAFAAGATEFELFYAFMALFAAYSVALTWLWLRRQ